MIKLGIRQRKNANPGIRQRKKANPKREDFLCEQLAMEDVSLEMMFQKKRQLLVCISFLNNVLWW